LYSTQESEFRGIYIEFYTQAEVLSLNHLEEIEYVRQPVHASFAQQQGIVGQVFYDTWKFKAEHQSITIFLTEGMTQGILEFGPGVPRRIVIDIQPQFKSILSGVYNSLQNHFDVEDQEDDDKENES
jgi:hypothetical protein